MRIEAAIEGYYSRPRTASVGHDDARVSPFEFIEEWRGGKLRCKGCGQTIAAGAELRGGTVGAWHPSCHARRTRTTAAKSAHAQNLKATPRTIAKLAGSALSFDRSGCGILSKDGCQQHERFRADCFDRSVALGITRIVLDVNHDRRGLRGQFGRISNDGGLLKFTFWLEDGGPRERGVLAQIQSGEIHACSIAFTPEEQRYDGRVLEHVRGTLHAISLLTSDRRPAWYDTSISVETIQ